MEIIDIEFPAYFESIEADNDNIDVFVKLDDGFVYTVVVGTPSYYYYFMDEEGLDYYRAGSPDVIVRKLTKEHIWMGIENLLEDDGYWFKLYYLASQRNGIFDPIKMDEMIEQMKKETIEIFGDEDDQESSPDK